MGEQRNHVSPRIFKIKHVLKNCARNDDVKLGVRDSFFQSLTSRGRFAAKTWHGNFDFAKILLLAGYFSSKKNLSEVAPSELPSSTATSRHMATI